MTKRTRLLTVVAALALATGGSVLPNAPAAEAHVCTQARVHSGGSTTTVGSCHAPPCPTDHVGTGADPTVFGTGVGYTVCF